MGTLFIGLILLSACCYGSEEKKRPPPWPEGYTYSSVMKSLTNSFEFRYTAYVSHKRNEIRLNVSVSDNTWPANKGESDFIFTKNFKVYRYFPSFISGKSQTSCRYVKHEDERFVKGFSLPALHKSELNFKLSGTDESGSFTVERWERKRNIHNHLLEQDTVFIKYWKWDKDKKYPKPVARDNKIFTVPGGMPIVHHSYTYYDYVDEEPPAKIFQRNHKIKCKADKLAVLMMGTEEGPEDFVMRQQLFDERMQMVKEHNQKNPSNKLELNQFAYMTAEEIKAYLNCDRDCKVDRADISDQGFSSDYKKLPQSYDWRIRGAVSPVKDQGACGSCWAFAVTGAIESFYYIKHNKSFDLSEQMVMDCSWDNNGTLKYMNEGCFGGYREFAFDWIINNGGILTTADYGPYLTHNGYCKLKYRKSNLIPLEKYDYVEASVKKLKSALVHHGPVAVGFPVDKNFPFYKRGNLYKPKKPILGHFTGLLVGYGKLKIGRYWLIKTSLGTRWGDAGYMLLQQKVGAFGIKDGFVPRS